jgi:sensor histidine kinase YesM
LHILGNLFRDNIKTVIPIVAVVLVLNFTLVPLGFTAMARFVVGSVLIVIGLSLFLFGVEIGITPMGSLTGSSLVKTNNLPVVLLAGLLLGFFISIAEPGLMVLAYQVDFVTLSAISSWTLLVVVSTGLAIMVSLGFLRVVVHMSLKLFLLISYLIIFVLALFTQPEFLAIAFDSSGATTGILAVPFLLALAVGISRLRKDSVASEADSFGLVADRLQQLVQEFELEAPPGGKD